MTYKMILRLFLGLSFTACTAGAATAPLESCATNSEHYKLRSAELEALEKEDQADRTGDFNSIKWDLVSKRDLEHRAKVAVIFAEGCLKEPKDFNRAALVFQHGDVPEHYYQTFVWANTAVRLGDTSQRSLVAVGLDRYLVSIGQKQLFGTQLSQDKKGVWCVQSIESSFPDAKRIEFLSMGFRDYIGFTLKFYHSNQKAQDVMECSKKLKPSPAGTVPGFW